MNNEDRYKASDNHFPEDKSSMAEKQGPSVSLPIQTIDKYFLLCISICFIVSLASFGYFMFEGRGAFTLRDDFNTQILPFYIQVNRYLKSSLPGQWCWSLDLGASFINGFGYYALGSPFAWLSFLFPPETFPYTAGWLFVLKYVFAGATAYIYLKTMTKKGGFCEVIGAVAYAFCGFQATNILFFFFHDIVALFPLLLIGMERILRGKGYLLFSFAVFINCLANYYFFVGECLFLVIYYCFRFRRSRISFLKGFIITLLAGTLGVGMACILFLPSALYILGNPRAGGKLSLEKNLLPDLKTFLFTLKGIFFPGDTMHDHAAIIPANWNSASCWIPLSGCTLPLAYILKKRDWLTAVIISLGVFSFSPFLSSVFVFFTQDYKRWWYMLVLMAVLAGVKVLNQAKEYPVRISAGLNLLFLTVFYYAVCHIEKMGKEAGTYIFHPLRFRLFFYISTGSLLLTIALFSIKKEKVRHILILAATSFIAFATTFSTIYGYKQDEESTQEIMNITHIASQLENFDTQYRYEFEYWDNYYPLIGNVAGVGAFSSTCENSRFIFQELFDYWHPVRSMNKSAYSGLSELLGSKYILKKNAGEGETVLKKITEDAEIRYVVERPACPIGFKIDHYILEEDLMLIKKKKRGIALLHAAVINENDEPSVRHLVSKVTKADIDFKEDIDHRIKYAENQSVNKFERNSTGFSCLTDFEDEALVYFSIPNDPGWKITIDGVPAEQIDSGGMILLKVPAGDHHIIFRYSTPGLKAGIIITMISFISFMILGIIQLRKQR